MGSSSCCALTEPAGAREAALAERSCQIPTKNPSPQTGSPLTGWRTVPAGVSPLGLTQAQWTVGVLTPGKRFQEQQALSATSFLVRIPLTLRCPSGVLS